MKLLYTPRIIGKPSTSGASRKKISPSFSNCVIIKHKKLLMNKRWSAGRGLSGKITTHSKGRRILKARQVFVNRSYRDTSISFIGGFTINPYQKSVNSTVFSSSGAISIVPSAESHKALALTYLQSLFYSKSSAYESILLLNPRLSITNTFFLVMQLPKHSSISNLEVLPGKSSTLSRSPGVCSTLVKMDPRTSLSLVKLPSGVKKIVSIFSIGSLGKSSLISNNIVNTTSASSNLNKGKAPRSRGVAKNPVDHPHGGRTKSIRYPRTPWGLTTKYK